MVLSMKAQRVSQLRHATSDRCLDHARCYYEPETPALPFFATFFAIPPATRRPLPLMALTVACGFAAGAADAAVANDNDDELPV